MADVSRPAYLQGRGRSRGRAAADATPTEPPRPGQQQKQGNGWCDNSMAGFPVVQSRPGFGRGDHVSSRGPGGRGVSRFPVPAASASTGPQSTAARSVAMAPVAKFNDAAARHQEAAQRHLVASKDDAVYVSSSDEDDDESGNNSNVIEKVLTSFSSSSGDNSRDLGRTHDYLVNSFKTKGNVCLICIESVKKVEAIWNCVGCYTSFHITCIQKWIKDGVYQQTALSAEHFPHRDVPWFCPKCRYEYSQQDCPRQYKCYCGKVADPKFDPWLVPHSCGQECGRRLRPDCGHLCHLLCHPGPCPPCPKTVRVSCHCKKTAPQVRRCGSSEWSCGVPCLKPLSCGHHQCQASCHPGACAVCPRTSVQRCQCGRHSELRQCDTPKWHCTEVCGKPLTCGYHTCAEVCHDGMCGPCPRSGNRTCPCGKTKFENLSCTEDAPTCLETCGKTLECGRHSCAERCHVGPCGMCRAMVRKKCRCGKRDREIQCYKDFQCDTKCANMRDCGVHQCKRKCCDGGCPPCTMSCGKTLGCRQHKCNSVCHRGPCYPCPLTVDVPCACGQTKRTVPCGAEKSTKPPRCHQPCRIPPDCHHSERLPHHCHFGRCPPCRQRCDRQLAGCVHRCLAQCHDAMLQRVTVPDGNVPRAGPWERPRDTDNNMEVVKLLCPPCGTSVDVTCLGGHETFSVACSQAAPTSCKRLCGRRLACTNHTCEYECHVVTGAADDQSAGTECEVCELQCGRKRPAGCKHQCKLGACHAEACPPCTHMIRMRCHCTLVVRHVACSEWCDADMAQRSALQSCGGECPKLLACGHRCGAICHPAPCPADPRSCLEKTKVKCPCGRRRVELPCGEAQQSAGKLVCDERCQIEKEKQEQERAAQEKARLEEEQRRQAAELEEFERKNRGRKRRQRRDRNNEAENGSKLMTFVKFVFVPSLVVVLAVFAYWLLN